MLLVSHSPQLTWLKCQESEVTQRIHKNKYSTKLPLWHSICELHYECMNSRKCWKSDFYLWQFPTHPELVVFFFFFCPKKKEKISFTLTLKTCFLQKFPKFSVEKKWQKIVDTDQDSIVSKWRCLEGWKQCFKNIMIIIINFPQPNSIHGGGLSKCLVIKEEPNCN